MATKYYLLNKEGKHVDDVLRTKDELRAKVKELMQTEKLDWDGIDQNYNYEEVEDGGVSSEKNASVATNDNSDDFTSQENNDGKYKFTSTSYYKPNLDNDAKGWNKILDELGVDQDYKPYLELREGAQGDNKGEWDIRKNAIRVLYLTNEFNKFYDSLSQMPSALSSYLKSDRWLGLVADQNDLDRIKKDMATIVSDILKHVKAYNESGNTQNERQDIFDEVKEFDEEIENLHEKLEEMGEDKDTHWQMARDWASIDSKFNEYCQGKPTPEKMSNYLMEIATKQYHLGRLKMDADNKNSTLDGSWYSPEDKATHNVRISEDIKDYLDLKNTKLLGDEDQKALADIIEKFKKREITQEKANTEIHGMVSKTMEQLRASLDIFFKLMGVTDANIKNQFTAGLQRLDESEYQSNWRHLVQNYKETLKKRMDMFKKAHSNDMTAEDSDACLKELDALMANADGMLDAVNKGEGVLLLNYAKDICTRIENVKKRAAEAKKAFSKA